jgi:hypothetical protein
MNDTDLLMEKMVGFLRSNFIGVKFTTLPEETFLPGLYIDCGQLLIDVSRLTYVGDILHEGGHIALMNPKERSVLAGSLTGHEHAEATEMMVMAWTYAACLHLDIDPAIVFHDGYKSGGEHTLANFRAGRYFGVSMLQWLGMTSQENGAGLNAEAIYPNMKYWVRS